MSTISEKDMPAPRIELRWETASEKDRARGYQWVCNYNFVFPLGKYDIRAEYYGPRGGHKFGHHKTKTIQVGQTLSGGGGGRYSNERDFVDTPYRDSTHVQLDAPHFGSPPIYAVADGRAMLVKAVTT